MIKRIRVINFQCHRDTTIELGYLTVLWGEGDHGKSAFIRAIRAAMLNDCNDLDISHDEKRCEVVFEIEDNTTITWWKERGKGGCYRIETEAMEPIEFRKTGGEVPEQVAKLLGVGVMEVDATTALTPQLSDQFDPVFILGETGSKRSRILGKATRMNVVVGAQMKASSELNRFKRELVDQEAQLESATAQREVIPDTATMAAQLATIREGTGVLTEAFTVVDQARGLAEEYEVASSRVTALDFHAAKSQAANLDEFYRRLIHIRELNDRYQGVLATPVLDFEWAHLRLIDVSELVERMAGILPLAEQLREETKRAVQYEEQIPIAREKVATLQQTITEQCAEAGICAECGGLMDHTICGEVKE